MSSYPSFNKIPRLDGDVIITEKIDGTNGLIRIDYANDDRYPDAPVIHTHAHFVDPYYSEILFVRAGSRNRWLTPEDDNFGFARWVEANADDLARLGVGHHYGEWWGSGIQRGYGAPKGERYFSLFDVFKWKDANTPVELVYSLDAIDLDAKATQVPEEVDNLFVVPVLAQAVIDSDAGTLPHVLDNVRSYLEKYGSWAHPRQGYERPEGVVVYHTRSRQSFKWPFDK